MKQTRNQKDGFRLKMRIARSKCLPMPWTRAGVRLIPEGHSANRSLSAIEPVSATAKRKLENGDQRSTPETYPARAEIPPVTQYCEGISNGEFRIGLSRFIILSDLWDRIDHRYQRPELRPLWSLRPHIAGRRRIPAHLGDRIPAKPKNPRRFSPPRARLPAVAFSSSSVLLSSNK